MKLLKTVPLLLLIVCCCLLSIKAEDDETNILKQLRNKYDTLPEQGKFATGAAIGYGTSRVAVGTATSVAKVAGVAYVVSEVMDYTGVLDDIKIGGEAQATMNALKKKTLKTVNGFKSTIRRRLAPNGIKNTIEAAATKEKLATFGFAAGAFVGFML